MKSTLDPLIYQNLLEIFVQYFVCVSMIHGFNVLDTSDKFYCIIILLHY